MPNPVDQTAQRLCAALAEEAVRHGPLIIVIDDAHYIDPSSCIVLDYLCQSIRRLPLGLVLAHRPEAVTGDHPLRRLVTDARLRDGASIVRLVGLPDAAVDEYLREHLGVTASPEQVSELRRKTGGVPLFLTQYLALSVERDPSQASVTARQNLVGVADWGEIPDTAELVIEERLQRLDPGALRLLVIAATLGELVVTDLVQRISGALEQEVLDTLFDVQRTHGVLKTTAGPTWADRFPGDWYVFEHGLLQEVLYRRQSARSRRQRHAQAATAQATGSMTTHGSGRGIPSGILLPCSSTASLKYSPSISHSPVDSSRCTQPRRRLSTSPTRAPDK
jgi:predicted ATPase